MTITRWGEGGLAGRRWLAGSLVWTIQPNFVGGTEDGNNSDDNKTTHRDRLMKGGLLQSILRGWRPLIEASPPPNIHGGRSSSSFLLTYSLLYLVDTPVSQGADETGVPGAVAWTKPFRPRAYAAAAAAAAAQSVLCLPSCGMQV